MAQRVLIVEDDDSVREVAGLVLERAGFAVAGAADGAEALARIEHDRFDLVVLDLMLPGIDGFEVCRTVRATRDLPIVMLTARADSADVVRGLESGADDYVIKPFEPAVLAARARAVLRRAGTPQPGTLRAHDLCIDQRAHRVWRGEAEVPLTSIEFRLLVTLVANAGRVLSREALLEQVWGYDYLGDSRLVDMAVKRLRSKLGDAADDPRYIVTVRAVGYRFERG